jgi:hypothetical protein
MRPTPCSSHVESDTNSADDAAEFAPRAVWKTDALWKPAAPCAARARQQHFSLHVRSRLGDAVEIGEPERTYTVEPVEDPVPREAPAEPAEPSPVEEPIEPEKVPAP